MSDRNLVLAPESAVTAIYGNEKNPQLTPLEVFLRSNEVELFKERYGGVSLEGRERWFDKWLNSPHVVFVCSPKEALGGRHPEDVMCFVKRTLR